MAQIDRQHTPGPWAAHQMHDYPVISVLHGDDNAYADEDPRQWPNSGQDIAECRGPEREANARLIAAAPELLAALQRIAHGPWPDQVDSPEAQCRWDEQVAREAIALALGESA